MKSNLLIISFLFSIVCSAQTHLPMEAISFDESEQSIQVKPLNSDQHSSAFAILVKNHVAAHYHQNHTETIFVVKGRAEMKIADSSFQIQSGDYINIPEGAVHSVLLSSEEPLVVISVQSPEFLGKDRHFVEQD